jgi:hypothetical protein
VFRSGPYIISGFSISLRKVARQAGKNKIPVIIGDMHNRADKIRLSIANAILTIQCGSTTNKEKARRNPGALGYGGRL